MVKLLKNEIIEEIVGIVQNECEEIQITDPKEAKRSLADPRRYVYGFGRTRSENSKENNKAERTGKKARKATL